MKIAILDDYQDQVRRLACFSRLAGHDVTVFTDTCQEPRRLAERLAPFDALVLIRERTDIGPELLAALPRLRLISQTGKISNHIRLADCTRAGVALAEGVGSPVAPAELTWALVMAASRQLLPYCDALKAGHWQQNGDLGLGRALAGRTLGIWGYGKIGQRVARFGQAFDMQVQVWGSEASRRQAMADGLMAAPDQAGFFASSDVLSLHLRLNEATRHRVTAADLARMKPDALLVNTSRAELVEPGALVAALKAGRPGFAAVDVYEQEPGGEQLRQLLALPNVLCSPHLGYVEQGGYELYFGAAFDNLLAYAEGRPVNIANPEVLEGQDD
ncbi:3-phosphoglycerate dehydrogenase [Zobellella taiwanensis]|jgi:D-3-phosphoglycerate dehydrogenase|uniref:3-phosphoglycerate dehydrogenase n=1 Tax=Zobellella taiwanensis TaxID=347535 RepID=A0A2P7RDN2_9GAMM|nr:D-2-hydroxyacid dehydrogenase family protein [Zobellella taiwanensis]PSJ48282.1 3-phosphoglycerate dehydrogenase [Zobellella taiwanensis]